MLEGRKKYMNKLDNENPSEMNQGLDEVSNEANAATTDVSDSFTSRVSRRGLLSKTAAGGVAALAGAGALSVLATRAEAHSTADLAEYFNILATGEAMSATFYSHAIANHHRLGIYGSALTALEAIRAEEEMHVKFAWSYGGHLATSHFSFPHGERTFEDRETFLMTQQLIEELTSGALLAWIHSMATMGRARLAQIGGQLMQVEGGHRIMGRVIMGANPIPNWGFAPVVLNDFLQVPAVAKKAGILSPRPGNQFAFEMTNASFSGVSHTTP